MKKLISTSLMLIALLTAFAGTNKENKIDIKE
jgi:hypothetical protein